MKVLGISPLDKESTVTLVEDDVVTDADPEERFTRTKQQEGFPWTEDLESALGQTTLRDKLKRVEHHSTHAANAYFYSGFDEAVVVSVDGYGSGLAGSVSIGRGGKLQRIHSLEYPHSLGTFYESVTSALGFKAGRHEGKIVGLAAYGDPGVLAEVLMQRFCISDGAFRIVENNNLFFARLLASKFPKIDVAAAYQHVLERVAAGYV